MRGGKSRGLDTYFSLWSRFHPYGIGILFGWLLKQKRDTKLQKTIQNRVIYLVGLLSGIGLCFLVWYGAALFHEPKITDRKSP